MLIFLIGLPGSGKTTLGKEIAKRLNYVFLDTDEMICEQEKSSIDDIFDKKGEAYFRSLESKMLNKVVSDYVDAVVSTGGGLPCFNNNINIINESGIGIFLDVAPQEITKRLMAHKNQNRPMTRNKTYDQVLDFINKKMEERFPFYSQAKLIFSSSNISTDEILAKLNTEN